MSNSLTVGGSLISKRKRTLTTFLVWKQIFQAVWKTFDTDFSAILKNMREHRKLIESTASVATFEEILRAREIAAMSLASIKEEETNKRREVVYQWLSAANTEIDQETHQKAREPYPGTGHWLLKANRFNAWFDPDFCSTHLLWLCGIPGAGKSHTMN